MKKQKSLILLFKEKILPVVIVFSVGIGFYFYQNYKSSREYYRAALSSLEKKDFYQAIEYLKSAIYLDHSYSQAYLLSAKIYVDQINDYGFAKSLINKAMESGEKGDVLFYLRGKCNYHLGREQEAMADFDKALSSGSQIDSLYIFQGKLLEKHGKFIEAEIILTEAVKRFPRNASILASLGISQFSNGKYKESKKTISESLKLRPDGHLFYQKALCDLQLNDTVSACHDIANAIIYDYLPGKLLEQEVCVGRNLE
jgi:tetratricopeptide (TPR) repeat protein